jgi:hypothetical protein
MATVIWLGTTDGDVTVGTNWSGGAQPTAGDDVVITGSTSIDGATLSASGNLNSFIVRDYTGTIGSASADLVIDLAAASESYIDGSGKMYLDFNASDVDVDVIQTQAANDTSRGLHLKGSGLNNLKVGGSSSVLLLESLDNDIITYDGNAKVTTDSSASAVNYIGPGELTAYGDLTNIYATGSEVNYYGAAATIIQAESGARINYWTNADVTNANAHGGVVDLKDQTSARVATNTSVTQSGEILFGDNWTPTNAPSGGTYKIVSA